MAETRTIDGIKYAVCRTQADIDASGPDADILIEFDADADATIRKARNVRVVSCRHLSANDAKIGGSLWASDAKIGGGLLADRAKIGGDLWASDAKIGGGLLATGAKIGGDLWASGAKIGGSLWASDAKIGGGLLADRAKIGGDLWASDAKIGGDLSADGAKIGGVKVTQPTPAQVALLDQIAARVDRLKMSEWHGEGWDPSATGDCGTTHCLAGWAQALSDDPGVRKMEPKEAGKLLLPCCAHLWFAPQAIVERYLRNREYAEVGA